MGPIDNKWELVQVMVWYHQVSSHYLSQFWPRSISPYGVTRPQLVKQLNFDDISQIYLIVLLENLKCLFWLFSGEFLYVLL